MRHTHGGFIQNKNFTAFIDGIPDECKHDSNGDLIFESASGKVIYWYTYRQWAHLPTFQRERLIHEYHNEIEDPIVFGTTSCSKCKKPFFNAYDLY